MMRKVWTLLTACVFLCSCNKGKDDQNAQIFPLKEGNQWTYTINRLLTTNGPVMFSYTETRVIKGKKKVNNQTYYVLVNAEDITDTLGLFRSDGQRVYGLNIKLYGFEKFSNKEITVFKWPASEGEVIGYHWPYSYDSIKAIASAESYKINSQDSRKVTITQYSGEWRGDYGELFGKPGVGQTGYTFFQKSSSSAAYYRRHEEFLTSYILK